MRLKIKTAITALFVAAIAATTLAAPASASTATASTPAAAAARVGGNYGICRGPSGAAGCSYGITRWNTSGEVLEMETALNGTRSPANYCVDNIYDWSRSAGHYDARVVRVCRSNAGRIGGYWASAGGEPGSNGLGAMQKGGVCWGPDQATNGSGMCQNDVSATQTVIGTVNVAFPNNCGAHWTRNNDNTTSHHGGGTRTSCAS